MEILGPAGYPRPWAFLGQAQGCTQDWGHMSRWERGSTFCGGYFAGLLTNTEIFNTDLLDLVFVSVIRMEYTLVTNSDHTEVYSREGRNSSQVPHP